MKRWLKGGLLGLLLGILFLLIGCNKILDLECISRESLVIFPLFGLILGLIIGLLAEREEEEEEENAPKQASGTEKSGISRAGNAEAFPRTSKNVSDERKKQQRFKYHK